MSTDSRQTTSEHAAAMAGRFARHAPLYDATRWAVLLGRAHAPALVARHEAKRVLEVGCGTGAITAALAERAGEVIGVDCAPAMLRRAARRTRDLDNVTLLAGEYVDVAIDGGPFDAIVFSYSLSMIPDFETILDRACADLRHGGHIVVVDFLDALPPVRGILRHNAVTLGPERRDALRARLCPIHDATHRAWTGLWRWFAFAGSQEPRRNG